MSTDELDTRIDALRSKVSELPSTQRKHYYQIELKGLKDPDTYAVLNYFFLAGLHHFYLGKYLFGLLNLMAMLIGVVWFETFGWALFVLIFLIELPQLFRSQRICKGYNLKVMEHAFETATKQPIS